MIRWLKSKLAPQIWRLNKQYPDMIVKEPINENPNAIDEWHRLKSDKLVHEDYISIILALPMINRAHLKKKLKYFYDGFRIFSGHKTDVQTLCK